ncbi:hypothetical protein AVEN_70023-1 [Araneus ventricosus]|uniref:Uncharacterized protein n=1 Tax=Araneus ventricosus TaxID=182803 RepID=A0A4Y2BMZ2_ARAVE|nr:hypothetical protein AVEN_275706-1 [Araneus ventricosus]GBL93601.1 hypothetical protein AVEN_70023-1 [Araneus ventricosus]
MSHILFHFSETAALMRLLPLCTMDWANVSRTKQGHGSCKRTENAFRRAAPRTKDSSVQHRRRLSPLKETHSTPKVSLEGRPTKNLLAGQLLYHELSSAEIRDLGVEFGLE